MKPSKYIQSGVSMVEVLVALIVMSVGMLGIASLYVTALQAKTTSGSRMKAVNLAYDMADRIRANRFGATSYALAANATPAAVNCVAANCTPEQMAGSDLFLWNAVLNNPTTGLPGTIVRSIAVTAGTPNVITINLQWSEMNSGALTYSLQVEI